MLSGMVAFGQGYMLFGNRATATPTQAAVNARVYDVDGVTPLAAGFSAQMYWGTTADSLAPIDPIQAFRTDVAAAAGYINSVQISLPGTAAGQTVFVQMRAWATAQGASWEAAQASGTGYGQSDVIQVALVEAPTLPNQMVGLNSFALVPEPSTIALGLLGLGVLALRRRK